MATHQVDAGVQPLPRSFLRPPLHGLPGDTEFDHLSQRDDAALPAQKVVEGHAGQDRRAVAFRGAVSRNSQTLIDEPGT